MKADGLAKAEHTIIRWGILLVFLATFGDYILRKLWGVLSPIWSHIVP